MNRPLNKTSKSITLIICALVSILILTPIFSSPKTHWATIKRLDEKRETVLKLAAASAGASTAITVIPGDIGTPIADKLADISSYFIIIICAIYLEKYLLTITGGLTFLFLVPIACLLTALYLWTSRVSLKRLAFKLVVFGLAVFIAVPFSVFVSDMIEKTYEASIQETIKQAEQTTNEIEDSNNDTSTDETWVQKFLRKTKRTYKQMTEGFETMLNNMIEAFAVMIVTSCLIPIVVLWFFVWLAKTILNVDIPLPRPRSRAVRQ